MTAEIYKLQARRIADLLELRIPLLRRDTEGKDFRPGGGGERIIGGLMVRHPELYSIQRPDEEPVDVTGPITFKCVFGGEKIWKDVVEVLNGIGIETTVRLPGPVTIFDDGQKVVIQKSTWEVRFTLPQDWKP